MGMKWLITGGCGFIGTNLIRCLKSQGGHHIRVLDNLSTSSRDDIAEITDFREKNISELEDNFDHVELLVGDILDETTTYKAAHSVDTIVHLAANTGVGPSVEDPRSDCMNNVLGTFNMLEAARKNKVKRFVFASSGAPIGEVEPPIHEELAPHPVSPYGASKLAGEGYCSAYYKTFAVETVILRFGNVFGPGSYHKSSVIAKFIKQALNNQTLEIYGDGKQTRDFIYIEDLINAVILAANVPSIGGETFQIASNRETTVSEITSKLIDVMKTYGKDDIKVVNGETRLGDVKRNYSDTSKARDILGWQPKTSQEQGLINTVGYFINEKI